MIRVSDSQNNPVRWIEASAKKGTHRVTWDLRLPAADAVDLSTPEFVPPWASAPQGPLAAPGVYFAELFALDGGRMLPLGEAQSFNVKPVRAALDGADYAEIAAYHVKTEALMREVVNAGEELKRTQDLLRHMKVAAVSAPQAVPSLFARLDDFGVELSKLKTRLSGDRVRGGLSESSAPSIAGRAYNAANNSRSTQAETQTQKADFDIAEKDFLAFVVDLQALLDGPLVQLEADLTAAGAPSWR